MYKNKILTFLIVILSFPVVLLSQNTDETYAIRNFERNYDSLLSSFYIKQNSKVIRANYNKFSDNLCSPTSACNVPDSVFARRLRQLPSSIKLTYNNQVRNIIEYYIDKSGGRVSVMLGLSKYYFPIFEEILDRYSVPHELKYLVVIESALNPNAVSPAGASGLWQFMYSTGRMYDLRINSIVDDRKDPIKASVAAAKYLKDLYNIYNDWELALAAYNCGPGNVNKAIRRSGKTTFWGIYDYLPRETRGYVPSYIAACYVMNYYKEHNITPAILTKPIATDTVMLRRDIHFEQIADVLNIPYEQIKDLNPQYKQNKIMGSQDSYSLKLPIRYIKDFISLEDSIAEYNKAKYFEPEWQKKEYTYKNIQLTHKVRSKETWSSIAKRYGVKANDLKKWNGNKKNPPRGQLLTVNKTVKVEVDKTQEQQTQSPFVEESTVNNDVVADETNQTEDQIEDAETNASITNKPVLKKEVKQKTEPKEKKKTSKRDNSDQPQIINIEKKSNLDNLTKEERIEKERLDKKVDQGRALTKNEKTRKQRLDKKAQEVSKKEIEVNDNLTKEEKIEQERLNKKVEQGRTLTKKEKIRKERLENKDNQGKNISKESVEKANKESYKTKSNLTKYEKAELDKIDKKEKQGKKLTKKEKERKEILGNKEDKSNSTKTDNRKNKKNNKEDNNNQKSSNYKVKKGESIYSIATKHGMTVDELIKLNKLNKKNTAIQAGQSIKVK